MPETSISSPAPKDVLRYYVEKLKSLKNSGADFDETSSLTVQLRDYLETLDLSIETTRLINFGLGCLYNFQVGQLTMHDSDFSTDPKCIKDGFDPMIKALSILIEQPITLRQKNRVNRSANNSTKPTSDHKSDATFIIALTNLIMRIVDFLDRWVRI